MIFADKLILLRKRSGWSQEELAEQMNVTRQSVSKWEGAQSIPDLEKILRLSELFGVSTDFLLKDEIEEVDGVNVAEEITPLKKVSMETANTFLSVKRKTSITTALATFLCIMSPVCVFVLGAMSETPEYRISENMAAGIGMCVLFVLIAIAAALFILDDSKVAPFKYMEKEMFETEYGVTGMVKARKEQYHNKSVGYNIVGAVLCILAVIPLFIGAIIDEENDLLLVMMLAMLFLIAGVGVFIFVKNSIITSSFDVLLQEGDFSKEEKEEGKKPSIMQGIATAYWLIVTAVYLGYSLPTNDWEKSWIIWVVAGLLYPALLGIMRCIHRKKSDPCI